MSGGISEEGVLKSMENGNMWEVSFLDEKGVYLQWVNQYSSFYFIFLSICVFVLCYLLFKHPPKKTVYIHLGVVMSIMMSKSFFSLNYILTHAYFESEAQKERISPMLIQESLLFIVVSVICSLAILAFMHRPSNISYDKILKDEIWGVWYQENGGNRYSKKDNLANADKE